MKIATISSKNQITLPVNMLSQFNIGPNTQILIEKHDEGIFLKPLKMSVTKVLSGSLKKHVHPSRLGIPFREVREKTQELVAAELAKET